ncbi:MAG: nucleotidyltransferase domain-containing protein [Chloroflexi bacterium]|nr:nucleotidyltransferase domain-containing protein [Chloroflexota bacterium]
MSRGTVQRELKNLTESGIISCEVQGRQVYYRANRSCPIYTELKGFVSADASQIPRRPLLFAGSRAARNITIPHRKLAEFCRRHHITKLAFFGSVLRGDFRPDSDIDVLVEFEGGHVPGFAIVDMESELAESLGRKVDLRTAGDLGRHFRDDVLRDSELEYAQS